MRCTAVWHSVVALGSTLLVAPARVWLGVDGTITSGRHRVTHSRRRRVVTRARYCAPGGVPLMSGGADAALGTSLQAMADLQKLELRFHCAYMW